MAEQEKTKTAKEPEVQTVSKEQYDKLELDYEKVVKAFNKLLAEYNSLHLKYILETNGISQQ